MLPVVFQAFEECAVFCSSRCRLIQNNDINAAKCWPVMSERLPRDAFQAVSPGSKPTVLFSNSEPESWLGRAIWPVQNCKHFIAAALSFVEDTTEGGLIG